MRYFLCVTALTFAIMAGCSMSQGTPNYSNPVNPTVYAENLKQGFSTNYFKSSKKIEGDQLVPTPAKKYRSKNILDIYSKGFHNIRIRVRADLYDPPYENDIFEEFLSNLTDVVDECIRVGVAPVISWIHHEAEAFATSEERTNYLTWWEKVANELKNKNYHLAFNLFTEIGRDECQRNCSLSLRENIEKYNNWTQSVINIIRATGGNNRERIIILASPEKKSSGLKNIDKDIFKEDNYLMVEWHEYAAGPYNREICNNTDEKGCRLLWRGNGTEDQRGILTSIIEEAKSFTRDENVPSYFGAWMPRDNTGGALTQQEVINFGRFFAEKTKNANIPWSLNVLDDYYNTKRSEWITGIHNYAGALLNMGVVLDNIREVM